MRFCNISRPKISFSSEADGSAGVDFAFENPLRAAPSMPFSLFLLVENVFLCVRLAVPWENNSIWPPAVSHPSPKWKLPQERIHLRVNRNLCKFLWLQRRDDDCFLQWRDFYCLIAFLPFFSSNLPPRRYCWCFHLPFRLSLLSRAASNYAIYSSKGFTISFRLNTRNYIAKWPLTHALFAAPHWVLINLPSHGPINIERDRWRLEGLPHGLRAQPHLWRSARVTCRIYIVLIIDCIAKKHHPESLCGDIRAKKHNIHPPRPQSIS